MFDIPTGKPQSIGDLVGRSFRLYRHHIGAFFRALLSPTIVAAVGALGIQYFMTYGMALASGNTITPFLALGLSLALLVVAKWILTVRQLAFVRIVNGFADDYITAHAYLSKHKWQVLLVYLLGSGALVALITFWTIELMLALQFSKGSPVSYAVAALGLIAAPLGIFLSICVVVLVSFMCFSVIACEDRKPGGIVSRGINLIFGDFWRACAFGILLYIAFTAVALPLSLPLVVLSLLDVFQHGIASEGFSDSYQMPIYLMVLSQIWESLLNMLLWPVAFLAFGLFYHDLRLRQEGLDLSRQLDNLERSAR